MRRRGGAGVAQGWRTLCAGAGAGTPRFLRNHLLWAYFLFHERHFLISSRRSRAIFFGSTTSLVDADVAAGNCAFGGSGDCENSLDYHPWALALLLNTRYKVRAVNLNNAFDVMTSLYKLRKMGYTQKPSRGSSKAAEMRWAQVIFLKKAHMAEILSALSFADEAKVAVGPTGDGWAMATKVEQYLSDGSAAANTFWAAISTGPDKNDRVTEACFEVVQSCTGACLDPFLSCAPRTGPCSWLP